MTPHGRFDDLRAGTALAFGEDGVDEVLVARTLDEVAGVLAAVDRATVDGRWAFGMLAYEAGAGLDPSLPRRDPPAGTPLAWFAITGAPREVPVVTPAPTPHPAVHWRPDEDAAAHRAGVEAVREHIAAGLTYQCNLTGRWRARLDGDLTAFYADLAQAQRGAHNALLHLGDTVVASASPELFFDWRGDDLHLRPMKGTAARGRTTAEDAAAAARLRADPKERAENVMIVDLVRNDVGRLAEPGSVRATSLCRVERFETVLQLTSDVGARLRPDVGLVDVMTALFPCGSVTGAPKPRTMALIDELEDTPRGVYCGAIGWVAPPGSAQRARFSVAIRTVVVDTATRHAVFGAGGGITWSSDPDAEHAEMHTKARVLARRPVTVDLRETLALRHGRLRHRERHLARLADSAAYFDYACDLDAARAALAAATAGLRDARVRLRLHRDGRPAVDVGPLPPTDHRPVVLALDDEPLDAREPWPHHKTGDREPYDRRRARRPHVDDVVLVNERGELTETTLASLAVRLDGVWCTPPLGSGALPGVERAVRLEDGTLAERTLYPADLERASDLAVLSSLRGWRAARLAEAESATSRVRSLSGRPSGKPESPSASVLSPERHPHQSGQQEPDRDREEHERHPERAAVRLTTLVDDDRHHRQDRAGHDEEQQVP